MMLAFIIWSVVACIFLVIGFGSLKAEEEVGFFTFVKPPKTKDYKSYNHAVAILWFLFAFVLEIIGVPLMFVQQNSPIVLLILLATTFLVIGIMVAYVIIENKYRA